MCTGIDVHGDTNDSVRVTLIIRARVAAATLNPQLAYARLIIIITPVRTLARGNNRYNRYCCYPAAGSDRGGYDRGRVKRLKKSV